MNMTDDHLEIMLLCFCCPEIMPLSNCALKKFRDGIVQGIADNLEKLKAEHANSLIEAHEKCLQQRIKMSTQKSEQYT